MKEYYHPIRQTHGFVLNKPALSIDLCIRYRGKCIVMILGYFSPNPLKKGEDTLNTNL